MLLCFGDNGLRDSELTPEKGHPQMLSRESPDRINIAFDDHRLVANAGPA